MTNILFLYVYINALRNAVIMAQHSTCFVGVIWPFKIYIDENIHPVISICKNLEPYLRQIKDFIF